MHVLGCRIHEYHLGFGLALVAATIGALGKDRAALILFLAAGCLVLKDWRDLFPRLRDTASWRLWIHRVPARSGNDAASSGSLRSQPPSRSPSARSTSPPP